MSAFLDIPSASADCVMHADWIESDALFSNGGSSSLEEYARNIRVSGTTEALSDVDFDEDTHDLGGEQSRGVAGDAWDEIERRDFYCGGDKGFYPFDVSETRITLKKNWQSSPYIFQLLLKEFGHTASSKPKDGARLFEELCSHAAREYLGGKSNRAHSRKFGFPRPNASGFKKALQDLCKDLGEGRVNTRAAQLSAQKDAKLDIVAWISHHDQRSAQLIAFGQCATGRNWADKRFELQPKSFQDKWLTESFLIEPIKMFFVPRSIESERWDNSARDGGILFDQCRITAHIGDPEESLANKLSTWIRTVHSKHGKVK